MIISINNKKYDVKVVHDNEDKRKGLSNIKELPSDKGMLFVYDKPLTVTFWMKDTYVPLDIVFIDEDYEVLSIYKGQPLSEIKVEEDNVKYVLEVNLNSGIKEGDELDYDDKEENDKESNEKLPKMKVIASDGSTLMELEGGERIFSRKNTRTLIRMAIRANQSKSDSDYKKLGRKIFKYIKTQDEREPEYVEKKN